MMRRIPDVLDVWFDSGSMPYAQVHYPFENRGLVRAPLPRRLIVEYDGADARLVLHVDRARGGLFDRPPFRNCIGHGACCSTATG